MTHKLKLEEHKKIHVMLHRNLDELIADFLNHNNGVNLTKTNLMDLIQWSYEQTKNPDE
jgi:hypothetical protein